MSRVAIRCDGGSSVGAGHVARCLPIAEALERRGVEAVFVGHFDGLADWLLERHGMRRADVELAPCGIDATQWSGAMVDLYLSSETEVCTLAGGLPIATLGEATRCRDSGIWIDYHPAAGQPTTVDHLAGSAYIPVSPRFAAEARSRASVREVLVTVGGSDRFDALGGALAGLAHKYFPDARVWAPPGIAALAQGAEALALPIELSDLAPTLDLAVTGAGLTPYEMAAAGIPTLAVGLAENQRVVLDSCDLTGIALPVNGLDLDPIPSVSERFGQLTSERIRGQLSARGPEVVDGLGAERIADVLYERWGLDQ